MRNHRSEWLEERVTLTSHLEDSPYDPQRYLRRATYYEELGYPDFAASDAYRALCLCDEVLDEEGEYHNEAIEAIATAEEVSHADTVRKHEPENVDGITNACNSFEARSRENGLEGEPSHDRIAKGYTLQCYIILARTLAECGDLKSAYDFTGRGLTAFQGQSDLEVLQGQILGKYSKMQSQKGSALGQADFNPREDLPENGSVRREVYAWNKHEPNRFLQEHLDFINREIGICAPKCEVRVTQLPVLDSGFVDGRCKPITVNQLGVFAASDIGPHETVLLEPSVLTASAGLHESFCDACSARLPPFSLDSPLPSCPSCEDIFFCSQACFDRAQELYHPAICGIMDFDIVAKDPSPVAATNALYTLLIARTMAMAETSGIHPLDLPQIQYLWGDYSHPDCTVERTLPFSFSNNIAQPLHLLARLDKNPFAPENLDRYDTWVINTLLAKFRGTANAKMNERTGIPEVAGVHWLWCLANHSCAPNVRWEWESGKMGFVTRGGDEVVRWGNDKANGDWEGSIRAGEELLNHYCDVEMSVKERREWAVGPLGGICMCRRCCWEEEQNTTERA